MPWSTPPAFLTGQVATVSQLNILSGNLNTIGGTWTSYVPTLTNINKGNGTVAAAYMPAGRLIHYRFQLNAGSTTTYSAGNLGVSVPVAPHVDYTINGGWADGPAVLQPGGGSTRVGGTAYFTVAGILNFNADNGTGTTVTNAIPAAWGTSAILSFTVTYEAA